MFLCVHVVIILSLFKCNFLVWSPSDKYDYSESVKLTRVVLNYFSNLFALGYLFAVDKDLIVLPCAYDLCTRKSISFSSEWSVPSSWFTVCHALRGKWWELILFLSTIIDNFYFHEFSNYTAVLYHAYCMFQQKIYFDRSIVDRSYCTSSTDISVNCTEDITTPLLLAVDMIRPIWELMWLTDCPFMSPDY
jgi:hypothetical protein